MSLPMNNTMSLHGETQTQTQRALPLPVSEPEFLERCRDNITRLTQERDELVARQAEAQAQTQAQGPVGPGDNDGGNNDTDAGVRDFSARLSVVQGHINDVAKLKQEYESASGEEKRRILASQYPAASQNQTLTLAQQSQRQPRQAFLPPFKSLATATPGSATGSVPSSASSFQRLPHLMLGLSSLSGSSHGTSSGSAGAPLQTQTLQLTSASAAAPGAASPETSAYIALSTPNYQSQFVHAYQGTRGSIDGFASAQMPVSDPLEQRRGEGISLPSFSAATANIVNSPQQGGLSAGGCGGGTGSRLGSSGALLPLQAGFASAGGNNVYERPAIPYGGAGLEQYSSTQKLPKKRGRKKRTKDTPSSPFGGVLPPPHQLVLNDPQALREPPHTVPPPPQRGAAAATAAATTSAATTSCLHCGENHTPEWRRGPYGNRTLCNACGLFYRKAISKFGVKNANLLLRYRKRINNTANRRVPKMLKIPIGIIEEFDADATLDGNYNTIRKEE